MSMFLIGICGASGSGKTTLANELACKLESRNIIIAQDAYYRDHSELSFEERIHINYDEPQAFEHDALLDDMRMMREGKPITRKAYDYVHHRRADAENDMIQPAETVILEGIHAFYDKRLLEMMDLKIYVSADPDICLLRRIQRDILERGRELNGVCSQYMNTVKPMYEKYIRGYIEYADLIVSGSGNTDLISNIVSFYINNGKMKVIPHR